MRDLGLMDKERLEEEWKPKNSQASLRESNAQGPETETTISREAKQMREALGFVAKYIDGCCYRHLTKGLYFFS